MQATKLMKYGDPNFGNVEKGAATKLSRYGTTRFNNREKMLHTNVAKYGMKVSPNTLASTTRRSQTREIGFASSAYKEYLEKNGIVNASQLPTVKEAKIQKQMDMVYQEMTSGARLNGLVLPLFSREEYSGTEYNKNYKFKCNKCGSIFEDNLYSGNIPRCLVCRPFTFNESEGEREIVEFIKSLGIASIKQHDRTVLGGLELDILVPDKQIAIEFNGVFWHTEVGGNKSRTYHLKKTDACLAKNVRLLHIFDQEWESKQSLVKSMLAAQLGVCTRLHAR
jgi:hypothetical protein